MPYYDAELSGRIALHSSAIGPSSSGKSTIVSQILEHNFADTTIWIMSPTATTDPVWKHLQRQLTRIQDLLTASVLQIMKKKAGGCGRLWGVPLALQASGNASYNVMLA